MWLIYLSIVFAVLGMGVLGYSLFKKSSRDEEKLEPLVAPKGIERGPLARLSEDARFERVESLKPEPQKPELKKIEPPGVLPGQTKDIAQSLQADLESERKKVREITQELMRVNEREAQLKSELDALKKDLLLKDRQLAEAQQELDTRSGSDAELSKQLKAKGAEMALLEKDNQELALKSKNLEVKVSAQEKEIAALNAAMSELKAKQDSGEFVPKKEFDELNNRLTSSEAALRTSQEGERNSAVNLDAFRQQLAASEEAVRQSQEREVALQKEKSSLKQQLVAETEEYENLNRLHQSKLEVITILKNELSSKDAGQAEALAKLQKELEAAGQRIEELQKQLAEKEATVPQVLPGGVTEEEYNKLKEKLEAAEKVLRIIHGAQ